MSETEAHQLVARWRRILQPWQARTEGEAARNMERSCLGMVAGGFFICVISSVYLFQSRLWLLALLFGLCVFGAALALIFRFRRARHVLVQAQIVNRKP